MTSVREQMLAAFDDAVFTGLAQDGGMDVTRLERARQRAVDDALRPAVVTVGGGERLASDIVGEAIYETDIFVYGYVRAAPDESIETTVNRLLARVVRAALSDRQVGGLALDTAYVEMDTDLDAEGGARIAGFIARFEARYATAQDDPFTAA